MRSKNVVIVMVILMAFVLFITGCGGGGGGSEDTSQHEHADNDQTPDQEDYASYEPYPFTEEQLISLARSAVPRSSFDVSLLDDDEDDDFTASYTLRASDMTDEQRAIRAKRIVASMWKHAVKLAAFPESVDVPYREEGRTIRLAETFTSHGGRAQGTTQKRFLYVYPNFPDRTELETFPYTQYRSGGCGDEIMGTDCVGFVYQCAYAATKNYEVDDVVIDGVKQKGARMRFGPYPSDDIRSIVNKANWINTGLFPSAELIADKSQPPKPGDILLWSGHVGIAVRIDYNTIGVAHSTGKELYTCAEYASYADEGVDWAGYPSIRNGVNGFVVHTYSDYTRSGGPGMGKPELYRLRLAETERADEYDDAIVAKVSGTWKFVDAKHYYNYSNAFGVLYDTRVDKFVKYNPDDKEHSSSLVFNVTAKMQITDTGYQNVKEYVVSGDGHLVTASYEHGELSNSLWQIFAPGDSPSPFRVSGDILVSDANLNNKDAIRISFSGDSRMTISAYLKDVFHGDTEEWVIELERADGTEAPEPDEWIPKLSGDWEPVDYTCLMQDGDESIYYDKFVPYDAVGGVYDAYDGSGRSSQTITITPKRVFYWYRVENDGHVSAQRDRNELVFAIHAALFPRQLEVSGDILVGGFEPSEEGGAYQRVKVTLIDDLMTIDDESYDYAIYFTRKVKLRRRK